MVNGPFRCVHNPIFSSTAVTAVGLALIVSTQGRSLIVSSLSSWQVQVRLVESRTCGVRTDPAPRPPGLLTRSQEHSS